MWYTIFKKRRKENAMTPHELATEGIILKETIYDKGNKYTYILSRNKSSMVASFRIPLYSIRVEMTDFEGEDSYFELRDTFASEERAIRFFSKLKENLATPINCPYVFEDEMS